MDRQLGFFWSEPATGDELKAQLAHIVNLGANTVSVPHAQLTRPLLDQLHAHDVRVIAEQGLFVGEEVRTRFPDSIPIDANGAPFDRDGWYIPACPNHPGVRDFRLQSIAALLDHHGQEVAELWLDFIRFPVRWEGAAPELRPLCFCRHCLNRFLNQDRAAYSPAETAQLARAILHERHAEWVTWKCRCIADFVEEVKATITARGLALPLGIFALPWRRADFDGAIRHVAGQDLAQLAHAIDTFSPMVYHQLCQQPPAWIASVIHDHAAWTQQRMLPIIQSVHRPDVMTPQQLDQALAQALAAAPAGTLIFTLEPILASEELAAVVRRHFSTGTA